MTEIGENCLKNINKTKDKQNNVQKKYKNPKFGIKKQIAKMMPNS